MTEPTLPALVPMTVIGGFLGAGKTTLVNHLLANSGGQRLVVLVNDFGAVNIDASLIAAQDGASIALTNGCACCSIDGDFGRAIVLALRREPRPEQLIVEASGVADPSVLADIATLDPELSLSGVVVLVDQMSFPRLADDARVGDAVRIQIAAADLLALTKGDLASESERDATLQLLARIAPKSAIVNAPFGRLPVELAIGPRLRLDNRASARTEPTAHAGLFATATLYQTRPVHEAALTAALAALPESVLRVKGFARLEGGGTLIVQRVGRRLDLTGAESVDVAALVLIGVSEVLSSARALEPFGFTTTPPRSFAAREA